MNRVFQEKCPGFTLVELMVVVSIIAILSAVAIFSFSSVQKTSRDGRRKADLALIQSALEQYHADQNYYPSSIAFGSSLAIGSKTYLKTIPVDPQAGNAQYQYWANPTSCSGTSCTSFVLCAKLENPTGKTCSKNSSLNYEAGSP